MQEQVVHGFDVSGKESHCSDPFWFREHDRAAGPWSGTPIGSVADTRANQLIARLFLPARKTSQWNTGTLQNRQELGIAKAATRISCAKTYVRHMTAAPIEG
jgi:hypothetical protein